MPILSAFFGIMIRMYHSDHNPPHFHIQYGDRKVIMDIKTGGVVHGVLPPRLHRLVNEWRRLHIPELLNAWNTVQLQKPPKRIKPLE